MWLTIGMSVTGLDVAFPIIDKKEFIPQRIFRRIDLIFSMRAMGNAPT